MPWQEVCPMEERMRFVAELIAGDESMTELCERFGISRKTGYKLWRRYQREGPAGVAERAHAPHRVPWAISQAQAQAIMGMRRGHPSWGPKKLRAKLSERWPEQSWPALSTIGDLLRRSGMSKQRRPRRRTPPHPVPLTVAGGCNEVWAIDFKGWFRTGDGARCDPLTVTDQFSRYLLCAQVVARPDSPSVRAVLERLFRRYGLPRVIRSDNGAPFASLGAGGLSRLGAWWVKLGITPERIEPGKPEQNGAHERMHRTLKAETTAPPASSLAAQQLRFDRFRHDYNHERPHEALGLKTPARFYQPSVRCYPKQICDPRYPPAYLKRRIRTDGSIKWQGQLVFVSSALVGEVIGIRETASGDAELFFGPVPLGTIDAVALKLVRSSPERRGGRPSSRSSLNCEKVLPILPV